MNISFGQLLAKFKQMTKGILISPENNDVCNEKQNSKNVDNQIERLNTALSNSQKRVDKLLESNAKLKNTLDENKAKSREQLSSKQELIEKLRDANQTTREALGRHRENATKSRKVEPIRQMLSFSELCRESDALKEVDCFVAHEVMPLIAAQNMAKLNQARLMCDAVEIPSFWDRAVNVQWEHSVIECVDTLVNSALSDCDEILTIGPALGKELDVYGQPVSVIPNYRYQEKLITSNSLRQRCQLKEEEKLVLAISTIASGFEEVLKAFALLPPHVHLATLGHFMPASYEETVRDMVKELGLEERVHLFPPVDYDELTTTASSGDLGLIIRDLEIKNNYISLPNRVFDYIASCLPIVSPNMPDIAHHIQTYEIGEVLESVGPEAWADSILKGLENSEKSKSIMFELKDSLTWESLTSKILGSFSDSSHIAFMGTARLVKNNRTLRFTRTLLEAGKKVTICCVGGDDDIIFQHPNLNYVLFEKL